MSYSPDLSLRQDFQHAVEARQSMIEAWQQTPLALAENNEVFRNLRRVDKREPDVTNEYKEIRERLLDPTEGPIFVGFMGPNGSGKGTGAMGMISTLKQDEYIKSQAKENDVKPVIVTVPFALYAQAAKTPEVRAKHPYYYVEPFNTDGTVKQHGQFSPEDYTTRISPLMYIDILDDQARKIGAEDEVITSTNKKPIEKVLYAIESSTPSALPEEGNIIPARMDGTDRGGVVLANLFRDPRFSANTYVYAYRGDEDVQADTMSYRNDLGNILNGKKMVRNHPMRLLYTVKGRDYDVDFLPDDQRKPLLNFWYTCMASPLAIARGQKEFSDAKKRVNARSDRDYYARYAERLGNPANFFVVKNEHMEGVVKNASLNYFIDSLPVKNYPSVMSPEVRVVLDQLRKITP